jgi:hypothetical protein
VTDRFESFEDMKVSIFLNIEGFEVRAMEQRGNGTDQKPDAAMASAVPF